MTTESRASLERIADSLIESLDQTAAAHEHSSLRQVVCVVRASADASPIVHRRLLARDVVARLVYLFLGESAPAELKEALSIAKAEPSAASRVPPSEIAELVETTWGLLDVPRPAQCDGVVASVPFVNALPALSRDALTSQEFVAKVLRRHPNHHLVSLCRGDTSMALRLVRSLVRCCVENQVTAVAAIQALSQLLHDEALVEPAMLDRTFGLVSSARHQDPLVIYRQIQILVKLHDQAVAVRTWLRDHTADVEWLYDWFPPHVASAGTRRRSQCTFPRRGHARAAVATGQSAGAYAIMLPCGWRGLCRRERRILPHALGV